MLAYIVAHIAAFSVVMLIVFISYKGIKFLASFNVGKALLFTYLLITISGTLIKLLLKVLE